MDFLDELKWRGLLKDVTDLEGLREALKSPITLYCGYDPTADSLHVGHLQQLMLLKRYQSQGHHPIALIGGGTGMIGDPRPTTERQLLDEEALNRNVAALSKQIDFILNSDDNPVEMVNNASWLKEMTLLDFLRDFGKHFSIANMLTKETIASRLQSGISFTEFTYTILQSVDFRQLYLTKNVRLQIGGSDQWGNLVSGTELIRKTEGHDAKVFCATSPLIVKADGTKFGKSEGANVWLNDAYTDAYTFYQFFLNTTDTDIMDFTKRLSMKSVAEIEALEALFIEAPHRRDAQKALAEELTLVVHGPEGLATAKRLTEVLFSGDIASLSATEVASVFKDAQKFSIPATGNIVDVLVDAEVLPSKREARQLITSGGLSVNGTPVTDAAYVIDQAHAIGGQYSVLKRGKKTYYVLEHLA